MAEIKWSSALAFSLRFGILAGEPQFVQKFALVGSGRPQEAQAETEVERPHFVQNCAPPSATNPQFEQDNVAETMATSPPAFASQLVGL
jgi:hypothetical protein